MIIIQKNVSETALFFFTPLIQALPLVFIFIVMPLLAHIIDIINKKQFVAYSFFFSLLWHIYQSANCGTDRRKRRKNNIK